MTESGIVDPLLAYALNTSLVEPELVEVFQLDKRECDAEVARRSFRLFHQAATAGSAFAMCVCSRLCRIGWGCAHSNEDSFLWAKDAEENGFPPGSYEVGNCYEFGIGVIADLIEARHHYKIAAERGFGFAAFHLAKMYKSGKFGIPDT